MTYNIYCDGAASQEKLPNGEWERKAGGWAWALVCDGKVISEKSGGEPQTTNNRMELMAIYSALKTYQSKITTGDTINIYSDSAYCINIYTQWISAWKANGWRRGKKKEPIENVELIKAIYEIIQELNELGFFTLNFIKVKGHSGDKFNEYVDSKAVTAKAAISTRGKRAQVAIVDAFSGLSREEINEVIDKALDQTLPPDFSDLL